MKVVILERSELTSGYIRQLAAPAGVVVGLNFQLTSVRRSYILKLS
jgi:hypothetical protein